jgi:hypothetical protein
MVKHGNNNRILLIYVLINYFKLTTVNFDAKLQVNSHFMVTILLSTVKQHEKKNKTHPIKLVTLSNDFV